MRWIPIAAITVALSLVAPVASAERLKPQDAESRRVEARAGLSADAKVAAGQLVAVAEEMGDPELFLEAADLLYEHAVRERDLEAAGEVEQLANIAADIGSYLADSRNYKNSDWRPISEDRAPQLVNEAAALTLKSQQLVTEIEAEQRAAEEAERARLAAEAADAKRGLKPGAGMIIGGSAAIVIAAGGVGMLAAGMALGQSAQQEAESLLLPAELPRLEELDDQGAQANIIAGVGGAVAGVGLIVGVTLIVLGVKKKKKAGETQEAPVAGLGDHQLLVGGWMQRGSAGLGIQGSF